MINLMLFLLAALAITGAPAFCAEASDQEHEEDTIRRSPAHATPVNRSNPINSTEYAKPPARTESPTGSAPASTPAAVEAHSTPAGSAATASDATPATSPIAPSTPSQTTPAGNLTSTTTPPTTPADSASVAAKTSALLPSEVAPGPYENDRRKVRNWLLEAKKRGVGLNAYIPVWDDMESTVKSGGSDAAVKTKLDTICRNIGDQVKNSSSIQRFRPVKPTGVQEDPDIELQRNPNGEVIRVKWIGEKGSDPLFRDKADAWYQKAKGLLNPEERADPQLQRRLHDQRDMIYKEMSERWKTQKTWAPRLYKNMNQDLGANYNRSPYSQRNYGNTLNNDLDSHKWYGGSESATPDKNLLPR